MLVYFIIVVLQLGICFANQIEQIELAIIGPENTLKNAIPNHKTFAKYDINKPELIDDQDAYHFQFLKQQKALPLLGMGTWHFQLLPAHKESIVISTEDIMENETSCLLNFEFDYNRYVDTTMHGICFHPDRSPTIFTHERRIKPGSIQFLDTPVFGMLFLLETKESSHKRK